MSNESENQIPSKWVKDNFVTILIIIGLIVFTVWNRNSDFDDVEQQCLAKASSQSTKNPQYSCSCVRTQLSKELGYLSYAPLIRIFVQPSEDEVESILKDAMRACF